jgi:hypothetical protein
MKDVTGSGAAGWDSVAGSGAAGWDSVPTPDTTQVTPSSLCCPTSLNATWSPIDEVLLTVLPAAVGRLSTIA